MTERPTMEEITEMLAYQERIEGAVKAARRLHYSPTSRSGCCLPLCPETHGKLTE
jgi:hypothetical protein